MLSELPLVFLIVHYVVDNGHTRFALYIVYTVCVVLAVLIGTLGPWVIGGRYWNNRCIEEKMSDDTGKYQIFDNCTVWNLMANAEALVRLPF